LRVRPARRGTHGDAVASSAWRNDAGGLAKPPYGSPIPFPRGVKHACRCGGIAFTRFPAEETGSAILWVPYVGFLPLGAGRAVVRSTTSGAQRRRRTKDGGLRWGGLALRPRYAACPILRIARRHVPNRRVNPPPSNGSISVRLGIRFLTPSGGKRTRPGRRLPVAFGRRSTRLAMRCIAAPGAPSRKPREAVSMGLYH
jgi:hypothetical protein